jgi:hypothetical protein
MRGSLRRSATSGWSAGFFCYGIGGGYTVATFSLGAIEGSVGALEKGIVAVGFLERGYSNGDGNGDLGFTYGDLSFFHCDPKLVSSQNGFLQRALGHDDPAGIGSFSPASEALGYTGMAIAGGGDRLGSEFCGWRGESGIIDGLPFTEG